MYFKINIILIILSYQCINVAVCEETKPEKHELISDFNKNKNEILICDTAKFVFIRCAIKRVMADRISIASYEANGTEKVRVHQNCYVKMPPVDTGFMPLPIQGNVTKPKIIRPNGYGHYLFQHNTQFKLSCPGSSFTSPTKYALTELNVLCNDGFLEYRGRPLYFTAFKCKDVPVPSIKLTRMICQGDENNSILEVGFQTKHAFVRSYRICFNYSDKRTLYSWYYVNSPIIKITQIKIKKPSFISTRLWDGINQTSTYNSKNQVKALTRSFNSSETAKRYLKNRFLTPGQLLGIDDFAYVSEQHATYFYENTAPHWSELNNRVWKLLERLFRRNLIRGTNRHMIAAGTYGTLMLPDEFGVEKPLYLATEERVPVPKYIWKMDYDIDRKLGTVFIGYNHPHDSVDKSLHFCETVPCPGELGKEDNSELLFCCTKDAFEKVVGLFDFQMFKPF